MKMFFFAFSIILSLSVLIAGSLFFLRQRFAPAEKISEHIHPSIFSFFTTVYAFFLGFAIVTLWSAFLTAEANVTREADSLMTAYRLSRDLPNSQGFRQALADYVKSVVEDEWPQMQGDSMSGETQRRFERVWEEFHLLKPGIRGDNDLYLNLIPPLSEAGKNRLSRGLLIKGNLYPPIWVIIVFGFLTVIFGLYFIHMQQTPVRVVFDFMVIFLVLSCIYFVYDINTPFSGYIVVKPEIFQNVHAKMVALR